MIAKLYSASCPCMDAKHWEMLPPGKLSQSLTLPPAGMMTCLSSHSTASPPKNVANTTIIAIVIGILNATSLPADEIVLAGWVRLSMLAELIADTVWQWWPVNRVCNAASIQQVNGKLEKLPRSWLHRITPCLDVPRPTTLTELTHKLTMLHNSIQSV